MIADTYRVTLPWQDVGVTVGVKPVNVLHVHNPTAIASSVATDIATVLAAHAAAMFDTLYTGLTLPGIVVLPLDGVSSEIEEAVSGSPHGGGSGGVLPAVATVVSLHTAQRGSRGRGRVYVGPMGETQVSNGSVAGASLSTMLAGWGAFQGGLAALGSDFCVASYKHADQHPVSSIRLDTLCGTQRRRQNQLR